MKKILFCLSLFMASSYEGFCSLDNDVKSEKTTKKLVSHDHKYEFLQNWEKSSKQVLEKIYCLYNHYERVIKAIDFINEDKSYDEVSKIFIKNGKNTVLSEPLYKFLVVGKKISLGAGKENANDSAELNISTLISYYLNEELIPQLDGLKENINNYYGAYANELNSRLNTLYSEEIATNPEKPISELIEETKKAIRQQYINIPNLEKNREKVESIVNKETEKLTEEDFEFIAENEFDIFSSFISKLSEEQKNKSEKDSEKYERLFNNAKDFFVNNLRSQRGNLINLLVNSDLQEDPTVKMVEENGRFTIIPSSRSDQQKLAKKLENLKKKHSKNYPTIIGQIQNSFLKVEYYEYFSKALKLTKTNEKSSEEAIVSSYLDLVELESSFKVYHRNLNLAVNQLKVNKLMGFLKLSDDGKFYLIHLLDDEIQDSIQKTEKKVDSVEKTKKQKIIKKEQPKKKTISPVIVESSNDNKDETVKPKFTKSTNELAMPLLEKSTKIDPKSMSFKDLAILFTALDIPYNVAPNRMDRKVKFTSPNKVPGGKPYIFEYQHNNNSDKMPWAVFSNGLKKHFESYDSNWKEKLAEFCK